MKNNVKKRSYLTFLLPVSALSFSFVSWTSFDLKKTDSYENHIPFKNVFSADKPAEFKGGIEALVNYIKTTVKYPKEAKKNKITGNVIIAFIVNETGKVTEPKILQSADKLLDNEAIRVIEAMPDWKPAIKAGKKVSSEMQLPINFSL